MSESDVDTISKIIYEFAYSSSVINITNNLTSISSIPSNLNSWQTKEKSSSSLSATTLTNIKAGWISDSSTNTNYNNIVSGDSDILSYTSWYNGNVLRKRINGIVWQIERIQVDTKQSTFSFLIETVDGITFPNMYRGGVVSSANKETTVDKQVFFGINDSISTNKTSNKQVKISILVS